MYTYTPVHSCMLFHSEFKSTLKECRLYMYVHAGFVGGCHRVKNRHSAHVVIIVSVANHHNYRIQIWWARMIRHTHTHKMWCQTTIVYITTDGPYTPGSEKRHYVSLLFPRSEITNLMMVLVGRPPPIGDLARNNCVVLENLRVTFCIFFGISNLPNLWVFHPQLSPKAMSTFSGCCPSTHQMDQ